MKKILFLAVVAAVLLYLNRGPAPAPRSSTHPKLSRGPLLR